MDHSAFKSLRRAFLLTTVSLSAVAAGEQHAWKNDATVKQNYRLHLEDGRRQLQQLACPVIGDRHLHGAQVGRDLRDLAKTDSGRTVFSIAARSKVKICGPESTLDAGEHGVADVRTMGLYNTKGYVRVAEEPADEKNNKNLNSHVNVAHELFHHYQNKDNFIYEKFLFLSNAEFKKFSLYREAAAFAFQTRVLFEYLEKHPGNFRYNGVAAQMFFAFRDHFHDTEGVLKTRGARLDAATQAAFRAFLDMPETDSLRESYLTFKSSGRGSSEEALHQESLKQGNTGLLSMEDVKRLTTLPNGLLLYTSDRLPTDAEFAAGKYLPAPTPKTTAPVFKGS